jgi:LmbE family N-acetylglucosaminyl deacetylase
MTNQFMNKMLGTAWLAVAMTTASSVHADNFLWIGAHPDDEQYVAPIFGKLCVEDSGNTCEFLVLTKGENSGVCLLSGGCNPDLATVRTAEMADAADVFQANLVQGALHDVGSIPGTAAPVLADWYQQAGSEATLVSAVENVITAFGADTIFTMHPDIGVYCHGAHRAAGELTLAAVDDLDFDTTRVWLVTQRNESVLDNGELLYAHYQDSFGANPAEIAWDGNLYWDYLLDDRDAHASQSYPAGTAAYAAAPSNERSLYLMKYSDFTSSNLCEAL